MSSIDQFINQPRCDLGPNAWILSDLAKSMKNSRFLDLGVRFGASSVMLSVDAEENNNQVCGCDINFDAFYNDGGRFVEENYLCYLADSVTLGKNWDEDPFNIIFVDTLHTREIVLAELYFWSNHLIENGYFVFHDSHWTKSGGDVIGGTEWRRVDEAITEFFNLPKSVMEMDTYEDDDISLKHYPESYGMTFIQVKTLDAIARFKEGIDWKEVFEIRNHLNDLHFNTKNPNFIDCDLDLDAIENELVILPQVA